MKTLRSLLVLSSIPLLTVACGDDSDFHTGGTQAEGGAPTMVAVYSTYSGSAQVVLLNHEKVTNSNLISSAGTGEFKLNTALSSDVVLARGTGAPAGQVTVIDRTNGVLTVLDIATSTTTNTSTAAVTGQLKVAPDNFFANPYDIAYVDDTHAWVARWGVNTTPGACTASTPLSCGDDLLEYNPTSLSITGRRVSFPPQTVTATTGANITINARPATVIPFGDTLVVGLTYYDTTSKRFAEGKLGLVDLSQDPPEARVIDLAADGSAQNCGTVRKSGGSTVLVSCWGYWLDRHSTGGVYSVDISGDTPEVTALYEPREDDEVTAVSQAEPIGSTGHFVAEGDNSLYYMTSDSATPLVKHDSYAGYSILYDVNSQGIIYSDRTDDSMGIFMTSTSTATKVEGSDQIGMPPSVLAPIPQ